MHPTLTAAIPTCSAAADLEFRTGFAVGGGVEYAFTSNLSAKLEYLYYDLGTANYEVAAANSIAAGEGIFIYGSQKFDGNIVRLGLNYRFDWNAPVVARY